MVPRRNYIDVIQCCLRWGTGRCRVHPTVKGRVAGISPYVIVLTAEENDELERRTREYSGPYCRVVRRSC